MPNNTNVVLCDRTLHLVREDSKGFKASQKRSVALIDQLIKIGWTKESDLKGDDRQALRDAFALRFTPEAIKLINNKNAKGHDTAPDQNGCHFTTGGKPKNQAHWKGQITSGLNKLAKSIENRKVKQASGGANTPRDIFTRVKDEIAKLKTAVKREIEKVDDFDKQEQLENTLELLRAIK